MASSVVGLKEASVSGTQRAALTWRMNDSLARLTAGAVGLTPMTVFFKLAMRVALTCCFVSGGGPTMGGRRGDRLLPVSTETNEPEPVGTPIAMVALTCLAISASIVGGRQRLSRGWKPPAFLEGLRLEIASRLVHSLRIGKMALHHARVLCARWHRSSRP